MKISALTGYITLALTLFLTAGTAPAKKPDPLCAPVRAFVGSVGPDESREIAFHTSWGSNFSDAEEPALFAKQCMHQGYEPGRPACRALMEHGAVEFSNTNAERLVSCLAPDTRWGAHVQLLQGSFSLRHGSDNRGSHVKVTYGPDPVRGGAVLRLVAGGY